jgi:hypothetical protein
MKTANYLIGDDTHEGTGSGCCSFRAFGGVDTTLDLESLTYATTCCSAVKELIWPAFRM